MVNERAMYPASAARTVIRHSIAPGNAGILETVAHLRRLVAGASPASVRWALSDAGPLPQEALTRAATLYAWVQAHMTYVADGAASDSMDIMTPEGTRRLEEELRTPDYLLARIADEGRAEGDCDDYVILLAVLWRAVGLPVRPVLVSARADGEYDHVYVEVGVGSVGARAVWLPADAIHGAPLGWRVDPTRVTAGAVLEPFA